MKAAALIAGALLSSCTTGTEIALEEVWVWSDEQCEQVQSAYEDGQGIWTLKLACGDVHTGAYFDGKRSGTWREFKWRGVAVIWERTGPYVAGERHGRWIIRYFGDGGEVWEGDYINGEMAGRWTVRWLNGCIEEGEVITRVFVNWSARCPDGPRESIYGDT